MSIPVTELPAGTGAIKVTVQRLNGTGTVWVDDVRCEEGVSRKEDKSYYYHCDYLGSPRVMTDPLGNVIWRQDYYAFGGDYNTTAAGNTHKFTGHVQDAATGQYYAKARYFTTNNGRWSQPEPMLKGVPMKSYLMNPQILNPYVYCVNNPLKYSDPSGLKLVSCNLPGIGKTYLDDAFLLTVKDFLSAALKNDINVKVGEAFRTEEYQKSLKKNPRAITPASKSLHCAGFAIDINYNGLSAKQKEAIVQTAKDVGLSWGGDLKKYDPVHFYFDPGDRDLLIQEAQLEYTVINIFGQNQAASSDPQYKETQSATADVTSVKWETTLTGEKYYYDPNKGFVFK